MTHECEGGCGKLILKRYKLCDDCALEASNRPENVYGKGDAYEKE